MTERRLLQAAILIACLVPLLAGGAGMLLGQRFIAPHVPFVPDLDSHMRYLSGLLSAIGIGFVSCVPAVERQSGRMALLSAIVITGGLARAGGMALHGAPGPGHVFALGMELAVVPTLWLWQRRIARAAAASGGNQGAIVA